MSQLRRRFPRSITIAILLAFCGVSLVGLGVGGYVVLSIGQPPSRAPADRCNSDAHRSQLHFHDPP